jgi:hypothetical protein
MVFRYLAVEHFCNEGVVGEPATNNMRETGIDLR